MDPGADLVAARAVAPSLVRVEYTVRYDKGDPPQGGVGYGSGSGESALRNETPTSVAGFLIAPRKVVAADPMMHPRFVEKIAVRFGDQVVAAKFAGVATPLPAGRKVGYTQIGAAVRDEADGLQCFSQTLR